MASSRRDAWIDQFASQVKADKHIGGQIAWKPNDGRGCIKYELPPDSDTKLAYDAATGKIIDRPETVDPSLADTKHDFAIPRTVAELPQSEQDVIAVLRTEGRRMTRKQILDRLNGPDNPCSDDTIKAALQRLCHRGFVNNNRRTTPPGYTLTPSCPT